MSFDAKALKKLADACRKAGITHFKNEHMEFTLSPEPPASNYKKRKASKETEPVVDSAFKSDTLTEEALLLWSVADPNDESVA